MKERVAEAQLIAVLGFSPEILAPLSQCPAFSFGFLLGLH